MRAQLKTLAVVVALGFTASTVAVTAAEAQTRHKVWVCKSTKSARNKGTVIGAVGGGTLGAVVAGNGAKTEGAVLGGVLGAVVGGAIGNRSARDCDRYDARSDYRYDGYASNGYYQDRGYDNRYDDRYRQDERYGYGDRSGYRSDRYGCRTVETRTRDWNGRLVSRYEEVCNGY